LNSVCLCRLPLALRWTLLAPVSRTAAMTSSHRLDPSVDKSYIEQKEDIEHGRRRRQSSTKHGDRALAIIGDDRISLTDEDVRCKRFT
jgi:hypothetical protein